jgi:hypothetical protein
MNLIRKTMRGLTLHLISQFREGRKRDKTIFILTLIFWYLTPCSLVDKYQITWSHISEDYSSLSPPWETQTLILIEFASVILHLNFTMHNLNISTACNTLPVNYKLQYSIFLSDLFTLRAVRDLNYYFSNGWMILWINETEKTTI